MVNNTANPNNIQLWVLTFPLQDCSGFDNFVITIIYDSLIKHHILKPEIIRTTNAETEILICTKKYGINFVNVIPTLPYCFLQRRSKTQNIKIHRFCFHSNNANKYMTVQNKGQCEKVVSCVPNVASFFGLSILDCPIGFSNVYLNCWMCIVTEGMHIIDVCNTK